MRWSFALWGVANLFVGLVAATFICLLALPMFGTIERLTTDYITAIATTATVLVGIGQATLFVWQLSLIRRSLKDTERAADAARDSADAAVSSTQARFFVVVIRHSFSEIAQRAYAKGIDLKGPYPHEVWIEFEFKNYGQTAGIVTEIGYSALQVAAKEPEHMAFDVQLREVKEPMIGPGKSTEVFSARKTLTVAELQSIKAGSSSLYFHGRLDFIDVRGKRQLHRFKFEFIHRANGDILQPIKVDEFNAVPERCS